MNATRNIKAHSPMTNNEAMNILISNFATDTLPQFVGTPRATDTILVSAWMPDTTPANSKAYGLNHNATTQRFNRNDLQMACQIAEQDPFQTAKNVEAGCSLLQGLDIETALLDLLDVNDTQDSIQAFDGPAVCEYETALLDLIPRAPIEDRPAVTVRVRSFVSSCRSVLNYSSCRL